MSVDNKSDIRPELVGDQARETFAQGYNCAQAVFSTFAKELGLDKETAYKIAASFGGGMRQGEVCGAITGALMAIGMQEGNYDLEDKDRKGHIRQLTMDFFDDFRNVHNHILCRDLLGYSVMVAEEAAQIKEQELSKKICRNLVHDAAELAEVYLKGNRE